MVGDGWGTVKGSPFPGDRVGGASGTEQSRAIHHAITVDGAFAVIAEPGSFAGLCWLFLCWVMHCSDLRAVFVMGGSDGVGQRLSHPQHALEHRDAQPVDGRVERL